MNQVFHPCYRHDRRREAMLPAAVVVAILSIAMSSSTSRADSQVRRFWGNEALWGYWEFGDDYLPKRDWKIVSVSHEAQNRGRHRT